MPAVVQHKTTFGNGVTSVALPFASNNTAGNLLAYASGGGPSSLQSMGAATDGNTNTIVNAVNLAADGSSPSAARWDYVANSNSGANTVTAHSPVSDDIHLHIWEISGCATSSPVRAIGSIHSATASVATNTSTPLTGDAVLAFFGDNPANDALTIGAGYTTSDISSNGTGGDSAFSEYKIATAGGTQTATCSGNSTHILGQIIAVFIQAAASGGTQATTTSPYLGIWSKDSVLACGGFDVGIPISFGLFDDDFVAQFSGATVGATATGMSSVPVGVFDRDSQVNVTSLYGAS